MAEILTSDASLPPPFIHVAGIANFRDLGGHPIASSPTQSIRQNFIYRCADPTQVSPDGIKTLQELGVKKVYDLRSDTEVEGWRGKGNPPAEWEGCERVSIPVFALRAQDPVSLALRYPRLDSYAQGGTEGFGKAYSDILEEGTKRAYRTMLLHIANEPEKPLIVHCTAGKDRTGVICALLLSLCGVDDHTVAKEYELTEQGFASMVPAFMAHLKEKEVLQDNPEGRKNLLSARYENMIYTLQMVREKYGGPEEYMLACGISKKDVEDIRKNMIREAPAAHRL